MHLSLRELRRNEEQGRKGASKLELSFLPFLPPPLPKHLDLQQTFLGLDLIHSGRKNLHSRCCQFLCFFNLLFLAPPPQPTSFLVEWFLNNLSLVWRPEICPQLGQESQGVPGPLEISHGGPAAVSAGFAGNSWWSQGRER